MLRRVPIESTGPVVLFAATRLAVTVIALIAIVATGFPYGGQAAAVVGGLMLPWAIGVLIIARRDPEATLHPIVPAVDFGLLAGLEIAVPETLGAVRVTALFFIAAHAHFQGAQRGIPVAVLGSALLVICSQLRGDEPVPGDVLAVYEVVFVLAALATGLVVGTLRTAESASRLRARRLSRRTIQAESEVRRRVAQAIHDGPVQELIGLDMILSAARNAAHEGRGDEATDLIEEAHELTSRNIRALRDEIVDLGPYAFQELSFATAIENCIDVWRRRYGFEVMATIQRIEMPPQMAGDLFRIAQEAVANAGRHAGAQAVSISLRTVGSDVELRITDNGHGFQDDDPFAATAPGHLGLATMRERAELLDGRLDIETSARGTRVLVRAPLRKVAI
jgi:signal transduction histidine kinase